MPEGGAGRTEAVGLSLENAAGLRSREYSTARLSRERSDQRS